MKKEFVPYEEALALKELGFREPCLGWYLPEIVDKGNIASVILGSYMTNWTKFGDRLSTPTFSQAFRWFREKYNIHACYEIDFGGDIYSFDIISKNFKASKYKNGGYTIAENNYEEAELACLKKLIEIIKTK